MATEKIRRSYDGSDSYMLENGQTLHDLFVLDLADFVAQVPDLDDPFAADWQDAIDAAVNYQDDTATQADIAIQTGSVKQQMELCRLKYDDVIYFAQKAFGKNGIEIRAFGKGTTYTAASRSQGKMRNFMDELHQAAEKHKTALIAAGFTRFLYQHTTNRCKGYCNRSKSSKGKSERNMETLHRNFRAYKLCSVAALHQS